MNEKENYKMCAVENAVRIFFFKIITSCVLERQQKLN